MKKQALLFVVLCLSFWGVYRFVAAQEQSDSGTNTPSAEVATPPASPEQVMQTWRKRGLKLLDENPDVLGVAPSPETGEIIVETDRPDQVPKTVDGVPVKLRILKLPPHPQV